MSMCAQLHKLLYPVDSVFVSQNTAEVMWRKKAYDNFISRPM